MPQGGVDKGESAARRALRELEEEIGFARETGFRCSSEETDDWL